MFYAVESECLKSLKYYYKYYKWDSFNILKILNIQIEFRIELNWIELNSIKKF
jgi:hypothetical protein